MTRPDTTLRNAPPPAVASRERSTTARRDELPDALALFARLTDDGRRPGCVLFETPTADGSRRGRSLLLPEPLLRAELRGARFVVEALDDRGRRLLPALQARLGATFEDASGTLVKVVSEVADDPGTADRERLLRPSVLDDVRGLVTAIETHPDDALPVFLAGSFGHELVDRLDGRVGELPPRDAHGDDPDLNLVLAVDAVVLDQASGEVTVSVRELETDGPGGERRAMARFERFREATARADRERVDPRDEREPELLPHVADLEDGDFLAGVQSLKGAIARGDIFQAVLSRRLTTACDAPPLRVHHHLRRRDGSRHGFYFELGDGALFGTSPETCVRVTERCVTVTPIAGTIRRGRREGGAVNAVDAELDARLAVSLLLDRKEQSEHVMLVDLARNDVARCSVPGTRRVESPLTLASFSQVHHVTTRVVGDLRPELDALDAYRACANLGTVTGAPKRRALELLREREASRRGYYGGGFGYLSSTGDLDTCLVIRSLRHRRGPRPCLEARSGAGVVADSRPEAELQETLDKARAPLLAIASAAAEAGE